jgi:hypothetical protein
MKGTMIFAAAGLALLVLANAASAYVKHHRAGAAAGRHAQTVQPSGWGYQAASRPRHAVRYARHRPRRSAQYDTAALVCLPAELRAKVAEIIGACGTHVLRTFTPGALIAGTRHLSEHAFCRAADLAGNPACIYAHLRGFRGGVSTDYGRMRHVHVSWHPGGWEQGVRFVHGGGYRTTRIAAALFH